jgi:hypothetical protein
MAAPGANDFSFTTKDTKSTKKEAVAPKVLLDDANITVANESLRRIQHLVMEFFPPNPNPNPNLNPNRNRDRHRYRDRDLFNH